MLAGGTFSETPRDRLPLHYSDPVSISAPQGSTGGGTLSAAASPRVEVVESWTSTAADVEAWLSRAKAGDRFVYATGPSLVRGAAAALVGKLRDAGVVSPHNRRNDAGVLEYVIVRCAARKVVRPPVCDPNMMALLVELQDDAQNHRRCRSDAELGNAIGLTADQVKGQLKKLEAARFIERRTVPIGSDPRFRIVRVIATGAETAGPQ